MWWLHTYWWLENNNLWKAIVAWSVGLVLNAAWAIHLWVRKQRLDRKRHEAVMDKLDPGTPGGLGEIKKIIQGDDDGTEAPDDNGSDAERRHDMLHHTGVKEVHSIIPPMHGGGSAGHH